MINYVFSFHNYSVLIKFLRENEIEIVHLHGFIVALSSSILLALKRAKKKKRFVIVQTMHDFHVACPNSAFFDYSKNIICEKCLTKKIKLFSFLNSCDRRGLLFSIIKGIRSIVAINMFGHKQLIDKFIAPSKFMSEKLKSDGIASEKIFIVRNPIPIVINKNIGVKRNIICYFGRFSKEKDIPFIINSFAFWKEKRKNDFKLYLIGSGDEENNIRLMSSKSNFCDAIIIKNFMHAKELALFIEPCKYFVMASRLFENAPMGILEAVSLGIIPIVPDLGGMKETVENMINIGRTYKMGNVDSFVQKIDELEEVYSNEINKIEKLKPKFTQNFGVDAYLLQLSALYKEWYSAHAS